jgi:hypothetical protein
MGQSGLWFVPNKSKRGMKFMIPFQPLKLAIYVVHFCSGGGIAFVVSELSKSGVVCRMMRLLFSQGLSTMKTSIQVA